MKAPEVAWEVFMQEEDDPPQGVGWEPFAAQMVPESSHTYGGRIVWWRRPCVNCAETPSEVEDALGDD